MFFRCTITHFLLKKNYVTLMIRIQGHTKAALICMSYVSFKKFLTSLYANKCNEIKVLISYACNHTSC